MSRTAATVVAALAGIATLVPGALAAQPSRSLAEDTVAWWNTKALGDHNPEPSLCGSGPVAYMGYLYGSALPPGKFTAQCTLKADQPIIFPIATTASVLLVTSFTGYPFYGFNGLNYTAQNIINAATGLSLTIDGTKIAITPDLRAPTTPFPYQSGEAQLMYFAQADGYFYRTSFARGTHTVRTTGCIPACSDITYTLYIK